MITIRNLNKTYNKGTSIAFKALKGVSLEIKDGELLALTGKSGAGKSTLLHVLGAIDDFESGEYIFTGNKNGGEGKGTETINVGKLSGRKLAEFRNRHVGIVLQDFGLVEGYSVIENVIIPLRFSRKKGRRLKETALNALKAVDMAELANKDVNKLSGGQKQRVAIARAIVNDPDVILADEPTGALDSATGAQIMELFKKLNKEGKTVIIVTHDREIAAQCGRVIEIGDGKICCDSGDEVTV